MIAFRTVVGINSRESVNNRIVSGDHMNLFSEQINELKQKFAAQHPVLAPQFPVYLLFVLLQKRTHGDIFQFFDYGIKLSRSAHHLIQDDDSIDVAGFTRDEFLSLVMDLIGQCADYAISSSGELESDTQKLRDFSEDFTELFRRRFGDDSASTSAKQASLTFGDGSGNAKKQVLNLVGNVFGKSGRKSRVIEIRSESDPYGGIERWTDISDEDAYVDLLHDIVTSYFHNSDFFHRLRRNAAQFSGTFERIVALAHPQTGCLVFSLFGEADLIAAISRQYPGRIQRFVAYLDGYFDTILNAAIACANGIDCYFKPGADPLGDNFLDLDDGILFDPLDSAIPDLVVGMIPHGDRIRPSKLASQFTHGRRTTRSEVAYLEYVRSILGESGRAIIGISEHFLSSSQGRSLRKVLTETDLLETVYAIPADRKSLGSMNSAVIVLTKSKEMPGLVTFDGDGDKYVQTRVSNQEVLSHDGDWRPSRYAHRDGAELRKIFDNTPYPIRTLGELVDGRVVGNTVNHSDRKTNETGAIVGEARLPFIRVSDLLRKDEGHTFQINDQKNWVTSEKTRRVVDFSAVLISRIGNSLKPTYFEFLGSPIAIGTDVVALRLTPNVNLKYFLTQLNSRLVQTQLEMVSSGNVIRRITVNDLLGIKLPFPPIEVQDQFAFEQTAFAMEKAEVLAQKKDAQVEIKNTEYNVVAAISHNLNQKLGSIENDFDTLCRFLKEKEENGEILLFSDLVRRVQPGEAVERIPTLSRISDRLKDNLNSVYGTLKTVERIFQKQEADVEWTDIVGFIKAEVKDRFESPILHISVNAPRKAINIPIDRLAFRDALDNLISNAQKHGFTEQGRVYHVNFSISRLESETGIVHVRIVYKNDGKPFPEGFGFEEYKRLAARAGKTKGSGIGGFFAARVIDLHRGEFNEIRDAFDASVFPVQFEILLPVE